MRSLFYQSIIIPVAIYSSDVPSLTRALGIVVVRESQPGGGGHDLP